MKPALLLKRLDAPVRFLSFSITDVAAAVIPVFLGALFDSLFLIPVFGLSILFFLRRALKRLPKFYAIRCFYWSLPTRRFNSLLRIKFPPSNQRFWIK